MRMPIRHVARNIVWTTYGTAWGVWRISPANYTHTSAETKRQRLEQVTSMVKALTGEPVLVSLCPQTDPLSVVRAMTDDLDWDASQEYLDLADRVLTQLESLELTGRTEWLAVPLPAGGFATASADLVTAACAEVSAALGLVPAAIGGGEERRRFAQAAALASTWPSGIGVRPATEAEILWMYGHAARRGVQEPPLPGPGSDNEPTGRSVAALSEVMLTEGGRGWSQAGSGPGGRRSSEKQSRNPFAALHLQVDTEWGTSFQSLLALAEVPKRFAFPGAEFLAVLDEFDFPIDWVCRLKITSGQKMLRRTRQRARNLIHQEKEFEGEPTGVPPAQVEAVADLQENRERMGASHTEVDVQAMTSFCVWGPTPDEAHARALALRSHFAASDYTLTRPVGEQERLWYGMLPGSRTPRVMAGYAQTFLARDFAMAMPWSGSQLGDDRGPLFGLQLTGGGTRPVLVDFSRGPATNTSASAAFIGELGAGKSTALKAAMYLVLAAGRKADWPGSRGRAVAVDRTEDREWERFARACPGTTEVIEVNADAQISLDPLRIFPGQERARRTESFLTLLLNVIPMSDEGVVLSEAVAAVVAREGASMQALRAELADRGNTDPAAHGLARKLAAAARKDLSRVIFDPDLPPIQMSAADSVVFSVSALQMPKKSELNSDFRLERMEFEKVLGRALMYLVAAVCRQITFASKNEFAATIWDECWWLTSSPEGQELLLEMLRDGRKNNAAAFAGSHDPNDIGPEDSPLGPVLRGLITHRFLFRQSDRTLAARGLDFLGLPAGDPDLLELVTAGLSPGRGELPDADYAARLGECLYRDQHQRIGTMRVLIPDDPAAQRQIHSTPGRRSA
ncbi:putative ATP/GTP-binding protein (plasmid) [Actinacidiphila reveromycinica]|uniref:Putative ATP/GTP-binding protein n=1 Tax=Actinacidiphila reveromycinica TaxID=659352 RepID=A0A7R6TAA8_9ACTN|nr:ATP-binding protein [Streptomyces sp. SN-593]BBG20645.1 putative ATP/GTP-binding protein [Streptomyces sp. SN-593]